MEGYDVIVVLGAQIGVDSNDGRMKLAFHTEMRARAAGIAWQKGLTELLILSGGYNVGVRYDLDIKVPILGREGSDRKPDFTDGAKQKARWYRSEASVIAELIRKDYAAPTELLILEEDSDTTAANAQRTKEILWRLGVKRVGILTPLYHMEKALEEFQKVGLNVEPVFAEDLLVVPNVNDAKYWAYEVYEYYREPRGGRQWDAEQIREIMLARAYGDTTRTMHELV